MRRLRSSGEYLAKPIREYMFLGHDDFGRLPLAKYAPPTAGFECGAFWHMLDSWREKRQATNTVSKRRNNASEGALVISWEADGLARVSQRDTRLHPCTDASSCRWRLPHRLADCL